MTAREVLTEIPPRCRNPKCGAVRQRRSSGEGIEGACGYCRACYDRWRKAGRPISGPPDPRPCGDRAAAANAKRLEERAARVEDFAELRSAGHSVAEASALIGVSLETGGKYETGLRRLEGAQSLNEERQSAKEARMEDLAELLSWGRPLEEAARRVGITMRTAAKYEAEISRRERADVAA